MVSSTQLWRPVLCFPYMKNLFVFRRPTQHCVRSQSKTARPLASLKRSFLGTRHSGRSQLNFQRAACPLRFSAFAWCLEEKLLVLQITTQKAFGKGTVKENQMHGMMKSTAREQESRGWCFLLLFFCAHSHSSALWGSTWDCSREMCDEPGQYPHFCWKKCQVHWHCCFPLFKIYVIHGSGCLIIPCRVGWKVIKTDWREQPGCGREHLCPYMRDPWPIDYTLNSALTSIRPQ